MTIQQLEYVLAVDKYRHFVKASEACGVTQSTLSSMIQKLENELDIIIFNRNSHPVEPTKMGEQIISQAKVILYNTSQLKEMILTAKNRGEGNIKLGIIPTIAPYILPKLFKEILSSHPNINLNVSELTTYSIIDKLHKAELDMAILATPLEKDDLLEIPLFYEKFVAYISPNEPIYKEAEIISSKMPSQHMWVLKEGHCLRNQVFNFCDNKSDFLPIYEAGNIDTLIRIVDENNGYTIIPELHINLLNENQKKNIRSLTSPQIVREVSLVVRQDYVREKLLNNIAELVKEIIPEHMIDSHLKKYAIKL